MEGGSKDDICTALRHCFVHKHIQANQSRNLHVDVQPLHFLYYPLKIKIQILNLSQSLHHLVHMDGGRLTPILHSLPLLCG